MEHFLQGLMTLLTALFVGLTSATLFPIFAQAKII